MSGDWNTGDARKVFFLAMSFFWTMGATSACYFLPVYYTGVGFSVESAGLMVSAFFVTSVSLRPFVGGIVRALGYRKLIVLAGLISLAGAVGMACAGSGFWAGVVSRAVLGVGSSLFTVTLATYQAVAFSENIRGRAFSYIMAGCLLPMMTIVPLADWLLHYEHFRAYILLPAVACVGALLFAPFIPGIEKPAVLSEAAAAARNPFRSLAECLGLPAFRPALLSFFLFCLTDATAAFMAPMTAHYGLMASLFLSSNALVGVGIRLFCGRLLDKYPRWKLSAPSIFITAGAMLLASVNPTPASLVILGLAYGVGMGFGFPLHLAIVSDGVPEKLQPQAVSLSWFLMGIDFAMVPILMGWMGSRLGAVPTFRILCLVALAGTCVVALMWRRTMRNVSANRRPDVS